LTLLEFGAKRKARAVASKMSLVWQVHQLRLVLLWSDYLRGLVASSNPQTKWRW
jgi:hypothetical protein